MIWAFVDCMVALILVNLKEDAKLCPVVSIWATLGYSGLLFWLLADETAVCFPDTHYQKTSRNDGSNSKEEKAHASITQLPL